VGRYSFISLPFQKILQIKAHRGKVIWGQIFLKSEDETEVQLDRVFRGKIERFIDTMELAYNNVAIEPISIKREKGILSANWEFNKPEEMLFRQQQTTIQSSQVEDPLNQLKMRFVKGEISEDEYKTKLRVLQEK
jgi:hypothetical protein